MRIVCRRDYGATVARAERTSPRALCRCAIPGATHDLRLLPQGGHAMLIKGQADIEVFISDLGYICLKQRHEADGDQLIEIAPAYGTKVAGAIGSLQDFAQRKFEKSQLADD
jgi:hypothetical protein